MKSTTLLKQFTLTLCLAGLGSAYAADASREASTEAPAPKLSPAQKELAHDDGASTGKRSVAGSGHAVRFEAHSKNCYLTAVRIYGSRYGQPAPPAENAYIWLCDADFKLLSPFPFSYANFERGNEKWVTIPIKPIRVPQRFIIGVGFNPTATKGVYVHHDAAGSGNSLLGLPGRDSRPFEKGDWLIRAVVQEPEP